MNGSDKARQAECMAHLKEIVISSWIIERQPLTKELCEGLILKIEPFTESNMRYVGAIYSIMQDHSVFVANKNWKPQGPLKKLEDR